MVDAQIILSTPEKARREHLAERLLQVRDSFQALSEARPWMRLGRGPAEEREAERRRLRRRLKLVDELLALLEDVRRSDPAHEIANAYWGWIHRGEAPLALALPSARAQQAAPLQPEVAVRLPAP